MWPFTLPLGVLPSGSTGAGMARGATCQRTRLGGRDAPPAGVAAASLRGASSPKLLEASPARGRPANAAVRCARCNSDVCRGCAGQGQPWAAGLLRRWAVRARLGWASGRERCTCSTLRTACGTPPGGASTSCSAMLRARSSPPRSTALLGLRLSRGGCAAGGLGPPPPAWRPLGPQPGSDACSRGRG